MKIRARFTANLLFVLVGLLFSHRGWAQGTVVNGAQNAVQHAMQPAVQPAPAAPPSEMDRIFADDQRARQPPDPKGPPQIYRSDAEREAATQALVTQGRLATAKDFREAAFIFQHSHEPDDYLVAHTLALVAMAKGDQSAAWIAAASLDRYLMAIGRPQIYGTQTMTPAGQPPTKEPYNDALISDSLRNALGVPSLSDQERPRKTP
jgi:hypothetical protein